jgi:hypothetical protein
MLVDILVCRAINVGLTPERQVLKHSETVALC